MGWGAYILDQFVSGLLSKEEESEHINLLELKVVYLALQLFQHRIAHQCVALMCDNATVVTYVNKQGGTASLRAACAC